MNTNAAAPEAPVSRRPSPLIAQLRVASALAIAAAIFWNVGWLAIQPIDPEGPVTLVAISNRLTAYAAMAMLAVIAGGLGVLVAGHLSEIMGPVAVAAGLAALSARGAQSNMLGGYFTAAESGWPALGMIAETWLWLVLIGIGAIAGRWCASWIEGPPLRARQPEDRPGEQSGLGAAIASAIVAAPPAYGLIMLLGLSADEEVRKQQVFFSVGLGFFLAAMLARFALRPTSLWWPLLAIGAVATAAYMVSAPGAGGQAVSLNELRTVREAVARPLPIEYAALGAIGCYFGIAMASTWIAESQAEKKT